MLQLERIPVKWNRFTAPPILRCHPREGGDRVTPAMLRSTVGSPLEFSPAKAGPGTTGSCDSMRTKCALISSQINGVPLKVKNPDSPAMRRLENAKLVTAADERAKATSRTAIDIPG